MERQLCRALDDRVRRRHRAVAFASHLPGRPIPRWHTATFGWQRGAWSATLSQLWRSSYRDEPPDTRFPALAPSRVAPYQVWDAQLAYGGGSNLGLAVGVKNLFDRAPPFSRQGDQFQRGYDPSYADPRGRTGYVRASYRLALSRGMER